MVWDPITSSNQASLDQLGIHLSFVTFPLLSTSYVSDVVSIGIDVGSLPRGGHMGSHGGGSGMICCRIPLGNTSTPPLIVTDLSSCLGESEDSRIRYNLQSHIVLSDLRDRECMGLRLASCFSTFTRERGRRSFKSIVQDW